MKKRCTFKVKPPINDDGTAYVKQACSPLLHSICAAAYSSDKTQRKNYVSKSNRLFYSCAHIAAISMGVQRQQTQTACVLLSETRLHVVQKLACSTTCACNQYVIIQSCVNSIRTKQDSNPSPITKCTHHTHSGLYS